MLDEEKTQGMLIEELQRLRNENAAYKEQLQTLTGINSAIVYVLDSEGYFTYLNNAVEQILRIKPEELLGRHFSTILPQGEREKIGRLSVLPIYKGKITGPYNSPKLFDERRSGDRKTVDLEIKVQPRGEVLPRVLVGEVCGLYDSKKVTVSSNMSEAFIGSYGIMYDITNYKHAEKEKMELQRRFLETQKLDAIAKLAGKVAHDLNNKLGSIQGCAEIIKNDFVANNPELRAYIDTILSASKHTAEMAMHLMELGIDDNRTVINIELHEFVEQIINLVGPSIAPNITLVSRMNAEKSIIRGNPYQLRNAVLNVITNAFDAMAVRGGELVFETKNVDITKDHEIHSFLVSPGQYIMLSISDTGIGMDKSVLDRLFQPFFTTKGVGKGLGLGLFSLRDCLKDHEGFVGVESTVGQGSVFKIYLPLKTEIMNDELEIMSSPLSAVPIIRENLKEVFFNS